MQNARSIKNKLDQLECIIQDDYDFVIVTETWLTGDEYDITLAPYSWEAAYRENMRGGGLLIATKNYASRIYSFNDNILIVKSISLKLIIISCYFPPNTDVNIVYVLQTILLNVIENNPDFPIILAGDFNMNGINWQNGTPTFDIITKLEQAFLSEIYDFFQFDQSVHFPTRNNNFFDLILSKNIKTYCYHNNGFSSDHIPMVITIHYESEDITKPHPIAIENWENAKWDNICLNLINSPWYELYDSNLHCQDIVSKAYELFRLAYKDNVPMKYIDPSVKPWLSREYFRNRNTVNKYYKKWTKFGNPRDLYLHRILGKRLHQQVLSAKKNFINRLSDNCITAPAFFWKSLPALSSKRSKNKLNNIPRTLMDQLYETFKNKLNHSPNSFTTDENPGSNKSCYHNIISKMDVITAISKNKLCSPGPDSIPAIFFKHIPDEIAEHLSFIFNSCLCHNYLPTQWASSFIAPILKPNKPKDEPSSYRPISLAPAMLKIFEHILQKIISFQTKSAINANQHFAQPHKSTLSNLANTQNLLIHNFENGFDTHVVYIDLESAFDVMDHKLLFHRLLDDYQIDFAICTWIFNYLRHRKSIVKFQGITYEPFEIDRGIPQGSPLSPLLFILFVNPIFDLCASQTIMYADDLKLLNNNLQTLQSDLILIDNWIKINSLKINYSKTKSMTFSLRNTTGPVELFIGNTKIESVDNIVDLGVTFDPKLSFKLHVQTLIRKLNIRRGVLGRNAIYFSNPTMLRAIYLANFQSIIDYAISIWASTPLTYFNKIISQQKKILKSLTYCANIPYDNSYERLCETFNLPNLRNRLLYFDTILVYKIVAGLLVNNFFQYRIPLKKCRTFSPLMTKTPRLTVTTRCFPFRAIANCNINNSNIPYHITDYERFKRIVKRRTLYRAFNHCI